LESFYLDELGGEEVKRPHPPAPLFPLALGLVVGIAADSAWALGTTAYASLFIAAALTASLLAALKRDRQSIIVVNALLAIGAAAGGGLLHDAHFRHLPDDHVARYVGDEPFDTTVIGQIVTSPRLVKPAPMSISGVLNRPPRTKFIVALERAEGADGPVELRGLVDVTVREPVFDLYCGDRIRIFGRLYRPPAPSNPGQFDWALAKRRQGIHVGLTCKYPEAIAKDARPGPAWRRALDRLRLEATTLLLDDVLEDKLGERSLLNAMVLGRRSQLDRDIYAAFERTGTSHFLALSGMHVGLLGLFGWGLGRLAGLSKRLTALLVLATLIVYALVVEPRPSVLRATVIGTMICLGYIFRKPTNMLNSMSLAALILLIWEPLQLFRAGFQLSFMATLGIIYLTPVFPRLAGAPAAGRKSTPAADAMGRKVGVITSKGQHRVSSWLSRAWQSMGRYFLYTLWLSLAAWFAISPLGAFHFNRIFTYVWLFTPLLMPLVLVTMVSGFAKLLLGLLWPSTSMVLGPILGVSTDALTTTVGLFSEIPVTTIYVPTPSLWWVGLYYLGLLAVLLWRSAKSPVNFRLKARWPAVIGAAAVLTAIPAFLPNASTAELRITLLAVGPGSATLIEMPNGEAYLYDAGTLAAYDVGRHTVMPALRERGIRRIHGAIISHPNFDHYSALFALCELVAIDRLIISPHFERLAEADKPDGQLLAQARALGIAIDHIQAGPLGFDLDLGGSAVRAEVLWPPAGLPPKTTVNDTSLVIRLTHAGRSILLTGDIDRYAQERLLTSGVDLSADVLILPHHGSVNEATADFIAAVDPLYVLQSSHHRSGPMASALKGMVADYRSFNTSEHGAITVTLQKQGLTVESFRPPDPVAVSGSAHKSGRNWE
ncbi:MAG: ComEC/Rec2 family competence protein, partial [Planctomycetes bacterium]|nr:ComEC/Rec2 family competence protein [Planctomycetota bacterium]